ncbi:MAG: class I tRNA ligase family protein, partial [Euryarchaeota archaeon]|nr:class I tRNA ligase family protein [Euryarchaeota archaeon]
RRIEPIAIIDTKGWGPLPAVEIVKKMGIVRSDDPRLEDAKKVIYREGFHTGRMNQACGEYAGLPVERAKDLMREMMISRGEAELFYDLSDEVICRCGRPVVIKKVPDQWFIDYGSGWLTEDSKRHASTMHILPSEYYANIQGVLDWFRERACVRQGNWLGTRFPFDDKWIIEAISDSTLYPIYYLVSKYFNEGSLRLDQLTEEFFDFVFLGKGDAEAVSEGTRIDLELVRRIRADVEYWYPLDINLGGKEHMTVHFPAFLMNHVGVLEEKYWPRGIFVNWYIIGKLGKISKSKGGAEPIPGAAEHFGVDPLRLYYAHIASPFADVEWDEEAIENYRARMERLSKTAEELKGLDGKGEMDSIDHWLLSRLNTRVARIRTGMREYDLRGMANEVYFEMMNDVRWYVRRGGSNTRVASRVLDAWTRLMAPITPHTAEEIWKGLRKECFVSLSNFPSVISDEIRLDIEQAEEFLREAMADAGEILKVTGISPTRITFYTSPAWKRRVFARAIEMARAKELSIPSLTKATMADPEAKSRGKETADYARKTAEALVKCSPEELDRLGVIFDEFGYLMGATAFMAQEMSCEIAIYTADDPNAPDPQRKARAAQPRRPAIFVE